MAGEDLSDRGFACPGRTVEKDGIHCYSQNTCGKLSICKSSSLFLRRDSKRGFISLSESPPSFSISASASTKATIASRIGTARGTGQKSERSYLVGASVPEARSTVGWGRRVVAIGFIAARTMIGCPLETPPSVPPALFVERCTFEPLSLMGSWACVPGRREFANASPTSTPLIACTDRIDM